MKSQTAKADDMIVITARKISAKIQPKIVQGNAYNVVGVERLKNGSVCLLCSRNKEMFRINEDRFSWRVYSQNDLANICTRYKRDEEEELERKRQSYVDTSFNEIKSNMTFSEHVQIAVVPLIIAEMAWKYTNKVIRYCADERIYEVKKLSRAVKKLREKYLENVGKYLDRKHLNSIIGQTQLFMREPKVNMNFTLIYYSVKNAFFDQFPQAGNLDGRIYAFIARLVIRAYKVHNRRMSALLERKLKHPSNSVDDSIITDTLDCCLIAYIGNYELKATQDMNNFVNILGNLVGDIKFNVTE